VGDDAVAAFLHFGYVPRRDGDLLERIAAALSAPAEKRVGDFVRTGTGVLTSCFAPPDGRLHVVPLSGGLDSRAVLAGLLGAGVKDSVVAVTVGTPGTFDFEIARQVAARAHVRHELIDLRTVEHDAESLESALVASDATSWAFDVFYHRMIPARFGHSATYWSGFLGGEVAGSHFVVGSPDSWPGAVRGFVDHARFCAGPAVSGPARRPDALLPAEPPVPRELLSYGDQLDFGVRQDSYVRRTVVVEGYDYQTPFLSEPWLRFMLSVPPDLRQGEALFKRILTATYPDLFSLPTKNTAGLPLGAGSAAVTGRIRFMRAEAALRHGSLSQIMRGASPLPFKMLNYLDFPAALRDKADVRDTVLELVSALDRRALAGVARGVRLWEQLRRNRGTSDLACAVTLLASLELNLRADGRRPRPLFGAYGDA
jgi:hypothetical protein